MSLTIKICKNTIILSNKAFSSLKETYLSFRDYPNLRHRCPSTLLAFFSDCTDLFVSYLVGNPEDLLSRVTTHTIKNPTKTYP